MASKYRGVEIPWRLSTMAMNTMMSKYNVTGAGNPAKPCRTKLRSLRPRAQRRKPIPDAFTELCS